MTFNAFIEASKNAKIDINDFELFINNMFEQGFNDLSIQDYLYFLNKYFESYGSSSMGALSSILRAEMFQLSLNKNLTNSDLKLLTNLISYIISNPSAQNFTVRHFKNFLLYHGNIESPVDENDKIQNLKLETRILNLLFRSGIKSIKQIIEIIYADGPQQLLNIEGIGDTYLNKIINVLKEAGYLKNLES